MQIVTNFLYVETLYPPNCNLFIFHLKRICPISHPCHQYGRLFLVNLPWKNLLESAWSMPCYIGSYVYML